LLQELCRKGLSWDETIPSEAEEAWRTWLRKLLLLAEIELPRCFKPEEFGEIKTWQLHHFADALCRAYAAVSYLRLVNFFGKIHCCFLIGKTRVAPLKIYSIPRLELTKAVLAAEVKVSRNGPERRSGKRIIAVTAFRLEFLVGWYCDADATMAVPELY